MKQTDSETRARAALQALADYNPLRNDWDAYWLWVARWGLGEVEEMPNPVSFGLPATMAVMQQKEDGG